MPETIPLLLWMPIMSEENKEQSVEHFLELIKRSRRGKFKIYIGMSAGVGKTYRMLQEAQALMRNGIDVKIGYIETHNRMETQALIEGLPVIPRRKLFYKGKELEEMDLNAIISQESSQGYTVTSSGFQTDMTNTIRA